MEFFTADHVETKDWAMAQIFSNNIYQRFHAVQLSIEGTYPMKPKPRSTTVTDGTQ